MTEPSCSCARRVIGRAFFRHGKKCPRAGQIDQGRAVPRFRSSGRNLVALVRRLGPRDTAVDSLDATTGERIPEWLAAEILSRWRIAGAIGYALGPDGPVPVFVERAHTWSPLQRQPNEPPTTTVVCSFCGVWSEQDRAATEPPCRGKPFYHRGNGPDVTYLAHMLTCGARYEAALAPRPIPMPIPGKLPRRP